MSLLPLGQERSCHSRMVGAIWGLPFTVRVYKGSLVARTHCDTRSCDVVELALRRLGFVAWYPIKKAKYTRFLSGTLLPFLVWGLRIKTEY